MVAEDRSVGGALLRREHETNEMKPNKRKGTHFRLFRFISFVSYSLFILI
jgi:hypothetical protein